MKTLFCWLLFTGIVLSFGSAQNAYQLSGMVVRSEGIKPFGISGIRLLVQGSEQTVTTDRKGEFSIRITSREIGQDLICYLPGGSIRCLIRADDQWVVEQGQFLIRLQVKKIDGPKPDTDGDGVPDDKDKCPNEAGTAQNFGCPAGQENTQWNFISPKSIRIPATDAESNNYQGVVNDKLSRARIIPTDETFDFIQKLNPELLKQLRSGRGADMNLPDLPPIDKDQQLEFQKTFEREESADEKQSSFFRKNAARYHKYLAEASKNFFTQQSYERLLKQGAWLSRVWEDANM